MVDRTNNIRPSQLNIISPTHAYNQSINQQYNPAMKENKPPVEIIRNDTMLAGYLMKRGAMLHQWNQRYFMLDGRYLDQFKSEHDIQQSNDQAYKQSNKQSKRIDLANYQVRSLSPSSHSRSFCFALQPNNQSTKQSYLFSARSERERSGWVDSINQAIRSAKQSNKQATIETVVGSRDQSIIQTDPMQSKVSLNECAACHESTDQPSNRTVCETCHRSFCQSCHDADIDSIRPNQCEPCFQLSHSSTEHSVRTTQRRLSDQSSNQSMIARHGSDEYISDHSADSTATRSNSLAISVPSTSGNQLHDPLLMRSIGDTPILIVTKQAEATAELVSPVTDGAVSPPNTPVVLPPLSPISSASESSSDNQAVELLRPNLHVVIPLDTTPSIKVLSDEDLRKIQRKQTRPESLGSPRNYKKPWWMCWA